MALDIHRTTTLPEQVVFGARGEPPTPLHPGCAKPTAEHFLMVEEAASAATQCHYLLTLARQVGMLPEAGRVLGSGLHPVRPC